MRRFRVTVKDDSSVLADLAQNSDTCLVVVSKDLLSAGKPLYAHREEIVEGLCAAFRCEPRELRYIEKYATHCEQAVWMRDKNGQRALNGRIFLRPHEEVEWLMQRVEQGARFEGRGLTLDAHHGPPGDLSRRGPRDSHSLSLSIRQRDPKSDQQVHGSVLAVTA